MCLKLQIKNLGHRIYPNYSLTNGGKLPSTTYGGKWKRCTKEWILANTKTKVTLVLYMQTNNVSHLSLISYRTTVWF